MAAKKQNPDTQQVQTSAGLGKQVHTAKKAATTQLAKIYHGSSAGSFRGPLALYKQARKQGLDVSLANCKQYLQTIPSYTLYRPARKNYPRNPIIANYCGEVFQIDIMDLSQFRDSNDSLRYALLGYDTFSKYAIAHTLPNRKPTSVQTGLEDFVKRLPFSIVRIFWDKEGSFVSKQIQKWLKDRDIANYTTVAKVKAPGVERLVRTVRTHLQRYFEATGSRRWIDRLQTFLHSYNNRINSTTKQRPLDLVNDPLIVPAKRKHHRDPVTKTIPPIGAHVRLNRLRDTFEKEASGSWSRELFKVVGHKTGGPGLHTIKVQDMLGNPVRGSLYLHECQQVSWDGRKTLEDVLEHRTLPGPRRQQLVTFVEYPEHYKVWIDV